MHLCKRECVYECMCLCRHFYRHVILGDTQRNMTTLFLHAGQDMETEKKIKKEKIKRPWAKEEEKKRGNIAFLSLLAA